MEELMAAIFKRWNDAGLNTSVAKLYPAGETPSISKNKTGSPEGSDKPRAEYFVMRGPSQSKSRNSRLYQPVATIKVWGTGAAQVVGFVDAINAAFVNSESAGTNPLVTSAGDVLDVNDGGNWTGKADDSTFEGEQTLLIRQRVNNRIPA